MTLKRRGLFEDPPGGRAAPSDPFALLEDLALPDDERTLALERLAIRNAALERELAQLEVIVRVLAAQLVEAGVLDRVRLDEGLDAALRALEPPRARAATAAEEAPAAPRLGAPYRGDTVPRVRPSPPPREVQCSRCAARVVAAETTVTEDGTLCAECFREVQLAQLGGALRAE